MTERLQFAPNFPVVVDLAVERDGGVAIVADDRLVAAVQIDDLQPDRAQGDVTDWKTPCWSGPRWKSDAVMRRATLSPTARPLCVKPAIPHIRDDRSRIPRTTELLTHDLMDCVNYITLQTALSAVLLSRKFDPRHASPIK